MKTTDDADMIKECVRCQMKIIDFIEDSGFETNMAVNAMLSLCFGRIWQHVESPAELREGVIVLLENFIDKFCKEDDV